jgi:hypothetical protein
LDLQMVMHSQKGSQKGLQMVTHLDLQMVSHSQMVMHSQKVMHLVRQKDFQPLNILLLQYHFLQLHQHHSHQLHHHLHLQY